MCVTEQWTRSTTMTHHGDRKTLMLFSLKLLKTAITDIKCASVNYESHCETC